MQEAAPLILTLRLNEEAFAFFDSLRKKHFPPERNFLSAHLTLFHHLPPDEPSIEEDIVAFCRQQPQMVLRVSDVVSIGKGVAYKIECEGLAQPHKRLQEQWRDWLTPQDKQRLWPHVTVQNKVSPVAAKETLSLLKESFQPFTAQGLGLKLWHYDGGPWRLKREFAFAG